VHSFLLDNLDAVFRRGNVDDRSAVGIRRHVHVGKFSLDNVHTCRYIVYSCKNTKKLSPRTYTVSRKKSGVLSAITLSDFNRFLKFFIVGMLTKFATKLLYHFPLNLKYVAALRWEITSWNLQQIRIKMQTKYIDFDVHSFNTTCLLTYYFHFCSYLIFFEKAYCCM